MGENETFSKWYWDNLKNRQKRIKLDPSLQPYISLQLDQRLKRLGTTKRKESIQVLEKHRRRQPGRIGNFAAMAENQEAMHQEMKTMKSISFLFSNNIHKTTCMKHLFCIISAPPASPVLIPATTEVTSLAQAPTCFPVPAPGVPWEPSQGHRGTPPRAGQLRSILCQRQTVADGYMLLPFSPQIGVLRNEVIISRRLRAMA